MIRLYRRKKSKTADEVQEMLEKLVLAHRVVDVDEAATDDVPPDRSLPILVESGKAYSGDEIAPLLDELATELAYERQFSADTCFMDPANPGRCV